MRFERDNFSLFLDLQSVASPRRKGEKVEEWEGRTLRDHTEVMKFAYWQAAWLCNRTAGERATPGYAYAYASWAVLSSP